MAGNTLGVRRYYKYTSDTGTDYSILTDKNLGDAAGLELADGFPPVPRRFKPRAVFCEATIEGVKVRKALICQGDSTLYADGSQDVVIDGTTFKTKGRRGEALTYGSNPAGSEPAPEP